MARNVGQETADGRAQRHERTDGGPRRSPTDVDAGEPAVTAGHAERGASRSGAAGGEPIDVQGVLEERADQQHRAGASGEGLEPAPVGLTSLSGGIVAVAWSLLVLVVLFALLARRGTAGSFGLPLGRWVALAFAATILASFLSILHAVDRHPTSGGAGSKGYGVFRPVIGRDNRWSTSLTQIGIWTVALGGTLAFLVGRTLFESGVELAEVLPDDRWDEYLILLGGPFAAAVLAKGIVTYKTIDGTLQKTMPVDEAVPKARQLVASDDGGGDLIDAQYLLFNLVALGYFLAGVLSTAALPEMPATLLGLTSGAAALYTANKAAASNPPTITSVVPVSVTRGSTITVFGSNFLPPGDATPNRKVTLSLTGYTNDLAPLGDPRPTDTQATFRIPPTATAGPQEVRLTSAAGVQTVEHGLEILPDTPVLLGLVEPASLMPGVDATIAGRNLGAGPLSVEVGGLYAPAAVAGAGDGVTFTVPPATAFGDDDTSATVTLVSLNGERTTIDLPVARPRVLHAAYRSATELGVRVGDVVAPAFLVNDRLAVHREAEDGLYVLTIPTGTALDQPTRVRIADYGRVSKEVVLAAPS
jgi:hypothetical protein